ncbi:MAG: hypothetical protein V3T86_02090 [Planctomycetota bacterium]
MATALLLLLLAAPDREALAKEYFDAERPRRLEILKELATDDVLTAEEVETWRGVLLKRAAKGRKLRKRGTNYWYDKKNKIGKYIVGGGNGKGGLLIGLHGGGKGAGDAGGAAGTFSGIASKFKCVGIFPEVLEKTERGWTTSGTEPFLLELIEAAKRTWKLDINRIYLVGHSMGGFGSWTVGAHHADVFAGLGPFAGAPSPITADGQPYGEVVGLEGGVIPNLHNIALHIYQSLDDVQVPPAPNIYANKELIKWKELHGGFNYKYVEVDGRGHGAPPGGHVTGVKWLYQFKRNARPKKILWEPVLSYKRMFYWIYWDRPVPNVEISVEITAPNEIAVDLSGYEKTGFRILLDDKLVDLSKEVVVKEGDEILFRGKVPNTFSTMLLCAGEKLDPDMLFAARIDLKD